MMTRPKLAAWIALALGTGVFVAALLGPLMLDVIRFRMTDAMVNQYVGGEIISVVIVTPMLIASGMLWRRGDRLAPALAFGPSLYTVYTFVTAIFGQEYARYSGNVENAFPLYAALVAGGAALSGISAAQLILSRTVMPSDRLRTVTSAVFLTVAGFFALAWIAQITQVYRGDPPVDYADGPTLFWLIRLLDLGFLLPAFAVTGFGLLHRHPLAEKAAYGMATFATCMSGAIAAMAIAMWLADDPAASPVMVVFLVPVTLALALAIVTAKLLVSYRRDAETLTDRSTTRRDRIGPEPRHVV